MPSRKTSLRIDRHTLADFLSDRTNFDPVLQVVSSIQQIREVKPLLERLLKEIVERIPAERAAVLQPDLQPAAVCPSSFEPETQIAAAAQRERAAILVSEPASQLCAPLRLSDLDLGAIYLESSTPDAFTERDLCLLAAIAPVAAIALDNAHYIGKLLGQKRHLEGYAYVTHDLLGNSPAIREVHTFINKVAGSNSTVLILGESGTGKELVARGIHEGSPRKGKPFIPLNCGAVQPELVENELFGHEKGSFTSAGTQQEGLVDVADQGTLFLDEIGELPLKTQAALLRFLQEREYRRVGGTRTLHADVRVVAATNRNLQEWVQQGKFRADLFYRLNVAAVRTPSLSQMREDIPLLVNRLLVKLRDAKPVAGISSDALQILMTYHWPGNVRQLQNAVECAVLMCDRGKIVEPDHLPSYVSEVKPAQSSTSDYYASMAAHQRTLLENALEVSRGNQIEAARILGISDSYFRRLARNLKLPTL